MFNLLVGLPNGGNLSRERLLEGTAPSVRNRLITTEGDYSELLKLPTLAMPEVSPQGSPEVAMVGALSRISTSGRDCVLEFTPNANVNPIPVNEIVANKSAFGIDNPWDFHRTRLQVKESDLYRILLELQQSNEVIRPSRKYLNFPDGARDEDLVVVMMPFSGELDPVWRAIRETVLEAGLYCERADSIWDRDSIMDDIVALLWRSRIVITDYTGRNANVFYEAGIAHTLGKQCIPITQPADEIPFDLRHLRTLIYEPNEIGLRRLKLSLDSRIRTILQNG